MCLCFPKLTQAATGTLFNIGEIVTSKWVASGLVGVGLAFDGHGGFHPER